MRRWTAFAPLPRCEAELLRYLLPHQLLLPGSGTSRRFGCELLRNGML